MLGGVAPNDSTPVNQEMMLDILDGLTSGGNNNGVIDYEEAASLFANPANAITFESARTLFDENRAFLI